MHDNYLTIKRLDDLGNFIHAFTKRNCGDIKNILPHPGKLFTVKQVHSDKICIINSKSQVPNPESRIIEADAIITNMKGLPIAVFTADCLPVILADIKGKAVGIVHAGRVGTSLEISKKAVSKIIREFGILSGDIIAVIGPGIGECCYEVDDNCINPFKEKFSYWKDIAIKKDNEKWMLNIKKANKMQLVEAGLKQENILTTEFCTSCHNERFFSYRREGRGTGRMISFVAIKE